MAQTEEAAKAVKEISLEPLSKEEKEKAREPQPGSHELFMAQFGSQGRRR